MLVDGRALESSLANREFEIQPMNAMAGLRVRVPHKIQSDTHLVFDTVARRRFNALSPHVTCLWSNNLERALSGDVLRWSERHHSSTSRYSLRSRRSHNTVTTFNNWTRLTATSVLASLPSRYRMKFYTSALLVTALGWLTTTAAAHTIQLKAHSRECFHETLHRDDKMTVTFQVGDREFGGSGNLEIDFWVS